MPLACCIAQAKTARSRLEGSGWRSGRGMASRLRSRPGPSQARSLAQPTSPAYPPGRGNRLPPLRQFFTSGPVACPYVAGRAERKLIVELAGSRRRRFLRRAVARRVSPQPPFRLPPGLPRTAPPACRCGSRSSASPTAARPGACATPTASCRGRLLAAARHARAVPAVHRLSALAPPATATWRR